MSDFVYRVFLRQNQFARLPSYMDPNSTEALRHCRYLRHYKRMNQTEKIAARYARNSCWQSKPFSVQEEFRALNRHGFVPSSAYWISSSLVRFLYTQIYMYCSENGGWFKKRNDCQLFSPFRLTFVSYNVDTWNWHHSSVIKRITIFDQTAFWHLIDIEERLRNIYLA